MIEPSPAEHTGETRCATRDKEFTVTIISSERTRWQCDDSRLRSMIASRLTELAALVTTGPCPMVAVSLVKREGE